MLLTPTVRVLFATLQVVAQPDTATYTTPGVRRVVEQAAELNHRVPAGLGRYTVRVESEISLGSLRREGQETAFTLEQVASQLTWDRSGSFEQHVIGHRAQQAGLTYLTLGIFRNAWVVPSLYGNRLALLFGRDTSRRRVRDRNADGSTVFAVHPLADDREQYYRYAGGDTILTIVLHDRTTPIVRLEVAPRTDLAAPAVLFTGEVDLDATRFHIVRMRGHFSRVGDRGSRLPGFLDPQVRGIANVELVNSEIEGLWWLPAQQRFELHATAAALADSRAIFRILTTFGPYTVTPPDSGVTAEDTLQALPHRLTLATRDSLGNFRDWQEEIGRATFGVSARDFDDVAPDFLRETGRPMVFLQAERLSDFVHGNRIEGPFTGGGVTARFRDAAPGLVMRAVGGYAWVERTMRGRLIAEWWRGGTFLGARVGRGLDITNDFRMPLDSGAGFGGIFGGLDRYDYVDRRSATVQAARRLGDGHRSELRIDAGVVDDRSAVARWETPLVLFGDRQPLRENRGVTEGRYGRSVVTLDWRPDVSGEFLRTGIGGRVLWDRGRGDLDYDRVEVRLAGRLNRGPVTLALRADAGVVASDAPPPQQLFELGRTQGLPGYEYKEFAGTRAAVVRTAAMYRLPLLTAPVRLTSRFWLPAPAPALAWSLQAGRADAPDDAARQAVAALGLACGTPPPSFPVCTPVSRPTGGWRASTGVGLRFFGGAVSLMAAKPLDGRGWRGVFAFGGQL